MRTFVFLMLAAVCTACPGQSWRKQFTRETLIDHFEAQARDGKKLSMPTLRLNAASKAGHLGQIQESTEYTTVIYRVVQQVDEGTLISVAYHTSERSFPDDGSRGGVFTQHATTANTGPFLFKAREFRNVPTDGTVEPTGCWEVTGTFDYQSIMGSRTVLVVERAHADTITIPENMPHPILYREKPRDWTDVKSGRSFSEVYVGYRSGEVWTMAHDNKVTKTSLFDLSAADQKWVRDQIKAHRRSHLIPLVEQTAAADDTSP